MLPLHLPAYMIVINQEHMAIDRIGRHIASAEDAISTVIEHLLEHPNSADALPQLCKFTFSRLPCE